MIIENEERYQESAISLQFLLILVLISKWPLLESKMFIVFKYINVVVIIAVRVQPTSTDIGIYLIHQS